MVDHSYLANGAPVEYLWHHHRQTGTRHDRDLFSQHHVAGFIPADKSIDEQAGHPDRPPVKLVPQGILARGICEARRGGPQTGPRLPKKAGGVSLWVGTEGYVFSVL